MDERTFFEHGDVKVTNARFISGGETYAMSNVTSVKALKKAPSRLVGTVLILIGLGCCVSNNPYVGIPLTLAAAFYLYKQKSTYHLMLTTASGEASALTTYQHDYITQVVGALNNAIVARG